MNDIGNYKKKSKNEQVVKESIYCSERYLAKTKRKIFEFVKFPKKTLFDKHFPQNENDKNLSGYFYDYKFGAGGLYLKVGVAGDKIKFLC